MTFLPYRHGFTLLLTASLLNGCRRSDGLNYPQGYREFAYVANHTGNTVSVLDLVFLRSDRTLAVGIAPVALAANPKRDEVYVVNAQPESAVGSISVIDTARSQVVATIPVHRNPASLVVDPTGRRAFVANTGSNTVTVLDLDTRRAISSFPTGDRPGFAVLSADGQSLVVTNLGSGSVSIFTAGSTTGTTPPLTFRASFAGCPGASAAVILPDSLKAFVACSDGHQVMALGLAAAAGSPSARQDAAFSSDHLLAMLDVGQKPSALTLKPDGGEVFVSNSASNSISEIATETNEVGSTYSIGNHPTSGLVSADNGALYVANTGADSISLYSIDDGKFLSSLRTGSAPGALAFSADGRLLLAADTQSGDVTIIRTNSKLGPALLTMLPAGSLPTAIVVKAMQDKP